MNVGRLPAGNIATNASTLSLVGLAYKVLHAIADSKDPVHLFADYGFNREYSFQRSEA